MFKIFKRLKKLEEQNRELLDSRLKPAQLSCIQGLHKKDLEIQVEYRELRDLYKTIGIYTVFSCLHCNSLFQEMIRFDPNRIDHRKARKIFDNTRIKK